MGTIGSARTLAAECEWVQAHAALTRLACERAAADAEEGRWLVRAVRAAVHVHLGHGSNDPANIITLCSAHHRANHRGQLIIEPSGDGSPRFRHADGSAYGHAVAPRVVDAQAKVFAGLRHLGFCEREVKAVLAELLADDEPREATAERLLRDALCRIRPTR